MAIKVKGLPQYGKQKVEISKDVSPEMIDPNVAVQSIKAQGQAKADTIISKGQAVQAITGAVGKEFGALGQQTDKFRISFEQIAPHMTKLGLTVTDAITSSVSLNTQFGIGLDKLI